jgi:hypothetical protein
MKKAMLERTMKSKFILCLALVVFNLSSHARFVRGWSDGELMAASDLVVVSRPIETKDLNETNSLDFSSTASFQSRFRGVETTFKVSEILKGTPASDQIVLHHYRFEAGWGSPPNGPTLMEFSPGDTNEYLLYLKNDGTNRYAPTSGQIDPVLQIKPPMNSFGFPFYPPITDVNPSIRCTISVRFPTKLKIERTSDMLSETIDTNSFESTNPMVGTNMVTGVESKIYVYPEGESRPANGGLGLSSGLDFNLAVVYWHTKQDGIPVPGKKYVVEMDLAAFETDIPPQHMWSPYGKNYKILWQRTLKQTVE